jgi:predicted alpha-1,2-mannosidase
MLKHYGSVIKINILLILILVLSLPTTASPVFASKDQAPARDTATEFYSSLETTDPQPTWSNTVETDANGNPETSGVNGTMPGLPGSIMNNVVTVTANSDNPPNETIAKLWDGDVNTKWLTFNNTGWALFQLSTPLVVQRYTLTSANDAVNRDPQAWQLQGSNDGLSFTTVDTRSGQNFSARFTTNMYEFTNNTPYLYYKLNITQNHGDSYLQLSEMQLSDGSSSQPPPSDMRSEIGNGPVSIYTAKSGMGWTGLKAFRYAGSFPSAGRAYSYNQVFDVNLTVLPTTQLSYVIFPEFTAAVYERPSTYAAIDLAFDDGTYLRDLGAVDQHGFGLNAQDQGLSKSLYAQQWNYISSNIGAVAAGKTIRRILVDYDNPNGVAGQAFQGWIDDIKIVSNPNTPEITHLSDWVDTRRGTNSNGSFSRGNNIPATAWPHGFNFWVPVTSASSTSWLYTYQESNNSSNQPTLQALSLSHEPSPWMGERQTFQVMPSPTGTPAGSRTARALAFSHNNEIAKPYYYGVTFNNGIIAELAPTDHGAIIRFTFTGNTSALIFDNVSNSNNATTLTPSNGVGSTVVTGYSSQRSGLSNGATRMYWYATFDVPSTGGGTPSTSGAGGSNVTRYLNFNTSTNKVVTMRIATSLMSTAQAQANLNLELGPGTTFDFIKTQAQQVWDDVLGVVTLEDATPDQMTTFYSDLYRLNLYPNSAFENTGTNEAPVYKHANQSTTSTSDPSGTTATQTGAPILNGKVYVNNGFWDTYRTEWALDSLLYPSKTAEMVDGFVQQYRDGGWIARWSSPGYANLMDGASSDVSFTAAYLLGAPLPDPQSTYDAALRNSLVVPPNSNVGRKGMNTSVFLGYTSSSTSEGFSWAIDGYINDYGIANMSKALYDSTPESDPRHQEYWDNYVYFLNRAADYSTLFDPSIGFFQGKTTAGAFLLSPAVFNPAIWGNGGSGSTMFTETNPWNMAFTVPQDGQGLANLYGGRAGLADKLDLFFATPELATGLGSYGTIHEMTEASAVRMGQLGISNQPSYHIPYMYLFAGQPYKTQAIVREIESRLFVGSEIGQGFPGDEDNGAAAGWQIFSSLGLYPLEMGNSNLVIGSPLFTKATIHLENGNDLIINAPNNSMQNVYVQSLNLDGSPYDKTYLPFDLIKNGATLDFVMGSSPSSWGTADDAVPPSITQGNLTPLPDQDAASGGTATGSGGTAVTTLFDNNSSTQVTFSSQAPWIQYQFSGPRRKVKMYTLTSGTVAGDPKSWVLEGSNDGTNWNVLDQRSNVAFQWRLYTRAFTVATPALYNYYRLEVTENTGGATTTLSEVELLANTRDVDTILSAVPASVQYSDSTTLQATISPAMISGSIATGSVEFFINDTSIGSAFVDNSGVATLPLIIDYAPGSYSVTAKFTSTNANFSDSNGGPLLLTVTQEDARAFYNGNALFWTSSVNTLDADVTLSAAILDITAADPGADGYPGDIRNARVTFLDRDSNTPFPGCSDLPVGLVDPADTKTGTAVCNTRLAASNTTGASQYAVGIVVNGYYTRNSSEDNAIITVAQPIPTNFITGGGHLILSNSSGMVSGDPGSKANFGFNVKYNKKGTNLQGSVNLIVRSAGRVYQIKSNAISSMGVNGNMANFTGKSSIMDITDPLNPISIEGNATLQLWMTDNGEPSLSDTLGIQVLSKNGGVWFSSNWDGTKTVEQALGGGNLAVR